MRGRRQGSRKRWYALMALAIFLHVLAMTNSDLGLDAHVRLNAAMDGQHDGQDLAWGKLRIADSSEQAPTNEQVYDGYIAPWFESELAAKFTAFVGVLCVACLAGLSPRWAGPSQPFNPMKPALILFSPIFLFVSHVATTKVFWPSWRDSEQWDFFSIKVRNVRNVCFTS